MATPPSQAPCPECGLNCPKVGEASSGNQVIIARYSCGRHGMFKLDVRSGMWSRGQ